MQGLCHLGKGDHDGLKRDGHGADEHKIDKRGHFVLFAGQPVAGHAAHDQTADVGKQGDDHRVLHGVGKVQAGECIAEVVQRERLGKGEAIFRDLTHGLECIDQNEVERQQKNNQAEQQKKRCDPFAAFFACFHYTCTSRLDVIATCSRVIATTTTAMMNAFAAP